MRISIQLSKYALLCLLLLSIAGQVCAGPISPGIWYEFGFDPNHSPLAAGCLGADPGGVPCRPGVGTVNLDARPWTFTSSTPVLFTITDGFLAGDFYDVLDLGGLVASTPAVLLSGHNCGLDPRICVTDPQMSHASFVLPAGAHSITVSVHEAQLLGEGFFEFAAVPEASTVLLVAVGLLPIFQLARARNG